MKIFPLSLAFLVPTASAWTSPTLHSSPIRSIALQQKLPTLLRSTPVKDAIDEEVVVNGATNPSEKEFGVVSSDKLNELYDLVVIGGVSFCFCLVYRYCNCIHAPSHALLTYTYISY